MILIVTALMLEGRPIRDRMGLKAMGNEPFPVFASDEAILVICGTGALKAAAATGWAMARFPGIAMAVNVGLAGAPERVSPLYRWHLVHAVRDQANGRLYIPDVLVGHNLPEAQLLTVGKVLKDDIGWDGLVDMEGSGFYEAARQFLSPDRIALLKWVSDPLSGTINAGEVGLQLESDIGIAVEFIRECRQGAGEQTESPDPPLLQAIRAKARLTRTQDLFLQKWIRGYLDRGGVEAPVLALLPEATAASKRDNNRLFEELKNVLKG